MREWAIAMGAEEPGPDEPGTCYIVEGGLGSEAEADETRDKWGAPGFFVVSRKVGEWEREPAKKRGSTEAAGV
jgi:hypothetical protein